MDVALPQTLLTIPPTSAARTRAWMVGQLLTATVIGRDTENSIRMRIDGDTLRATTQLPLRIGSEIRLQVVNTESTPTLRLLTSFQDQQIAVVRDALKQVLPRQRSLKSVAEHLDRAIKLAPSPNRPTPALLLRLVRSTLSTLPTVKDLTNPSQLANKLRLSGTGLESELRQRVLAGSAEPPENDLKWQLLRIRHATNQAATRETALRSLPSSDTAKTQAITTEKSLTGTRGNETQRQPPVSGTTTQHSVSEKEPATSFKQAVINKLSVPDARPTEGQVNAKPPPTAANAGQYRSAGDSPPANNLNIDQAARSTAPTPAQKFLANMSQNGGRMDANPADPPTRPPPIPAQNAMETPRMPNHRDALGDLLKHVDSAIARIQTNQLQTLSPEINQPPHLVFELPVRSIDSFELVRVEIEQKEKAVGGEDHGPIIVTVQIQIRDSDVISAKLKLQDKDVSVALWSGNPELRQQINMHKDWLKGRLEVAGLEPRSIVMVPLNTSSRPPTTGFGLIDTAI